MVITGTSFDTAAFLEHARLVASEPTPNRTERFNAIWAAAIATGDAEFQSKTLSIFPRAQDNKTTLYEIVLQSYLFLGFPRMLTAAETWSAHFNILPTKSHLSPVTLDESATWFADGMSLCKLIYGDTFEKLKERVESIAPEIFRWMIVEGYGKVLSRPGLSIIDRELCIVSSLMIENREQQMYSHIRGALNVGAPALLVESIISDIGYGTPRGAATAQRILDKLRKS